MPVGSFIFELELNLNWKLNRKMYVVCGLQLHTQKFLTKRLDWELKSVHISSIEHTNTAQKMKFSVKNFFSKCEQIGDLFTFTKKTRNGNLLFCTV